MANNFEWLLPINATMITIALLLLLVVCFTYYKRNRTDFGNSFIIAWSVIILKNLLEIVSGILQLRLHFALPIGLTYILAGAFFIRGIDQYLKIKTANYWVYTTILVTIFQIAWRFMSKVPTLIWFPGLLYFAIIMIVSGILLLKYRKLDYKFEICFALACILWGLSASFVNSVQFYSVMSYIIRFGYMISSLLVYSFSILFIAFGKKMFHGMFDMYNFLNNYSKIIAVYDLKNEEYFLVNKFAKNFFGLSNECTKEEIERSELGKLFMSYEETGTYENFQKTIKIMRNGKKAWLTVYYNYELMDGHMVKIVSANDITESKKTEEDNIESLEYFSTIFKITPVPFIILDEEGTMVKDINKAACDALLFRREEIIGITDLKHNFFFTDEEYLKIIHKIKIESYLNKYEYRLIRHDKKIITVLMSAVVISFSREKSILISFNDITDIKESKEKIEKFNSELEQKVRERTEQLNDMVESLQREVVINEITKRDLEEHQVSLDSLNKELVKSKEDLQKANDHLEHIVEERTSELTEALKIKEIILNNLGHELRTPLNGALGFISILSSELTDPEQLEDLKYVDISLKRLERTLNSLVMVTEIESNVSGMYLETYSLNVLVSTFFGTLKTLFPQCSVEFKFEEKAKDVKAYFDESFMNYILYNILDNAVKFTENGSITIKIDKTSYKEREWGTICISDTGRGIKDEDMKKIFLPFRQGDEGLSRNAEGLGLGLYISQKLMKMMNSDIQMESTVGKGTNVYLLLPISTEDVNSSVQVR